MQRAKNPQRHGDTLCQESSLSKFRHAETIALVRRIRPGAKRASFGAVDWGHALSLSGKIL